VRRLSASLDHFHEHGWMRLPGAFSAEAAAAMREVVWQGLATTGIDAGDPATWTIERPGHLQKLRSHRAFRAVGSPIVLQAIAAIMERHPCPAPRDWGSLFIAFPTTRPWSIPVSGWHIDAKYTSPLRPIGGVKTFALLGDVAPRGGGTLAISGSHRLVHRWFGENPPPASARSADMRKLLMAHPYMRDLHAAGDAHERSARFMAEHELGGGVTLQVVELTGTAGDVFLLHPLTIHAAAPNAGSAPRFMLSGGVTTDMWGWDRPRGAMV
jgi:hypothetical protein